MKHIIILRPEFIDIANYFVKNSLKNTDEVYFYKGNVEQISLEDALKKRLIDPADCQFHIIMRMNSNTARVNPFNSDGWYHGDFFPGLSRFLKKQNKQNNYFEVIYEGTDPDNKSKDLVERGLREMCRNNASSFRPFVPANILFHKKSLLGKLKTMHSTPIDLLEAPQENPINVIQNKLIGDNSVLAKYRHRRFGEDEKQFTGTMFGFSKDQKEQAVDNLILLLQGEGDVTKEDIKVLRQGVLGDSLRTAAQELANKLNMPEITTVHGLISFIQSVKGLKQSHRI